MSDYWPLAFYDYSSVFLFGIRGDGRIGIGENYPAYTLAVNGSIGCKELTVTNTGWSDFVFESYAVTSQYMGVSLLDSGFRRNDKISQVPVIPAKAGIQKCAMKSSFP